MLISKGPRAPSEDLVSLLLECHERIRRFVRLAVEVGSRLDAPAPEIIEACQSTARYFEQALPLHVRDEEESVLPRLRGHSAEVDAALETMHAQHVSHGPDLETLLSALRAVEHAPDDVTLRAPLLTMATKLAVDFEEHLTLEEHVLFSALPQALSGEEQRAVIAELRARRAAKSP
jgi:iron-sulfur cluster repair protein YtfE (RIC family)